MIDGVQFVDADSDGLADGVEAINANDVGTQPSDTDSDGIQNFIDLDSDNDGIADVIEGQPTATFTALSLGDSDSDGIQDIFDGTSSHGSDGSTLSTFSFPEDTDSYGVSDFIDTDTDSDGIADALESGLDFLDNGFQDTDSDGIDDDAGITYGDVALTDHINEADSDGEFDFRDTDSCLLYTSPSPRDRG